MAASLPLQCLSLRVKPFSLDTSTSGSGYVDIHPLLVLGVRQFMSKTAEPCQWQGCSGGNTERDKFSRTGMVANKENKQQQQLAQVILQLETRRR